MIDARQFSSASQVMRKAEEEISSLLGVPIMLMFEIVNINSITIVPELIVRVVSDVSGVSEAEIMGKQRTQSIVYARFVCFYLIRKHLYLPLAEIGAYFNMDHSSVIHGLKVVKEETMNSDLQSLRKRSEKSLAKYIKE